MAPAAATRFDGPVNEGARTPEELDRLLEDVFVVRDREALGDLFEPDAVLAGYGREANGARIGTLVSELWSEDRSFVADAGRVVQAGDTALLIASGSIGVARRAPGRGWRYAIALLPNRKERDDE